jgi:hypothetical protein
MLFIPHYGPTTLFDLGEHPTAAWMKERSTEMRKRHMLCIGQTWNHGYVPVWETTTTLDETELQYLCLQPMPENCKVTHA